MTDASRPFVEESRRDKTRITQLQAAALRLSSFTMRKATAYECTNRALLEFRTAEVLVKQAADRFRERLLAIPSAPDARTLHVDYIRKLGRLLWANVGVLDVSWQEFLRTQCVIERDDLD